MPPEFMTELAALFDASGTLGVWLIVWMLWRQGQAIELLKKLQRRHDRRIYRLEVHAGLDPLPPISD